MANPTWDETEELTPSWDDTVEAEDPSALKQAGNAIRGFSQGASLGFGDEIQGVLEAGGQALGIKGLGANSFDELGFQAPKIFDPDSLGDVYAETRDKARAADAQAKQENPGLYTTGEVAGGITTAFAPGAGLMNAGKGAGLATAAGKGALGGAVSGLGLSDADLIQGDIYGALADTGKGAAIGGGLGAAGHLAGEGLEALSKSEKAKMVTDYIANKFGIGAKRAAARGLGAERGTIKKLGQDKVDDIGQYALDNGLLSGSTDKMIARNEALKSRGGQMMGDVYEAIDNAGASNFNPLNVASKVDEELGGFYRSPINRGETNQLENTIESILMRGEGDIPLHKAQELKQELKKVANWRNTLNPTDKEKMARQAYGIVNEAIDRAADEGASAIGVPGLLEKLQEGKSLYGRAAGAEELLLNKQAREHGNKFIGLTDAITGAGSLGYGYGTGDWETAGGIMLAKKGAEKYGPMLAAKGLNNISQMVKQTPQLFGKFANVLKAAEQRGPQGIASTHFILQQTNPEYRQILQNVAGMEDGENGR